VTNNPKPDIFHQSIRLFQTRKLKFERPASDKFIRQRRPGSRQGEFTRTVAEDHGGTGLRQRSVSDDTTQPISKRLISTPIQRETSSDSVNFVRVGLRDVDVTRRSLFGEHASRSISASLSRTSFPSYGQVDVGASGYATRFNQVPVEPTVYSRAARTISGAAQLAERDPSANIGQGTSSELSHSIPNVTANAMTSAFGKRDYDRPFDSGRIERPPGRDPKFGRFAISGVANNKSPLSLPRPLRNSNSSNPASCVRNTLDKINTESSDIPRSTSGGSAPSDNRSGVNDVANNHLDSTGKSDDADQVVEPSSPAGELWLDTASLQNWFQTYLAGEMARSSRATNQPNVAFGHL